ncbi:BatA and WFA domain-containing protein [Lachnospiraceae bacterium 46-61]
MRFFQPWGFFALIGIPIIILMYLLKQKYKEQIVSSLFLWKKAESYSMAQQPWQKLKKNLLMILQIIFVFLLAIALANPYIMGVIESSHTVFALDCSLSMQAKDGEEGRSRLEQATSEVKKQIEQASPNEKFSIVFLKDTPEIALSSSADKKALLNKIENVKATNGGVNWQNSKEVLQIAGGENAHMIVFTDQYQELLQGMDIEQMILGKNSENTAITLLSHSQGENGWQVLAKVNYFGEGSISKTVNLFCDGKAFDRKQITIEGGESKDVIFTSIPQQTEYIMATLTPEDILQADDRAYDASFSQTKKKVLLVSEQNIFLEKVYRLLPDVELYKTDTKNIEQLKGYSLYIFDGVIPKTLPNDGFFIFWNIPYENNILHIDVEQKIDEPATTQGYGNMTLAETLTFDIEKSKSFDVPIWASTILQADEKPLAIAGEQNGKKMAIFAFDIHDTDLPLQKEFPILIYNLQNWFFAQNIQQSLQSIVSGQVLEISLLPETKQSYVLLPNEKSVNIAPPFPPLPFIDTEQTGIYTLIQKNETQQQTKNTFAVNAKTEGESDLIQKYQTEQQQQQENTKKVIKTGRSIQTFVIIVLLLLLFLEWKVNCNEY